MAAACPRDPLPIRPQPLAPTPRVPSWVPAPISNCAALGASTSSPVQRTQLWGKEALLSGLGVLVGLFVFPLFPLRLRGEGLAPA